MQGVFPPVLKPVNRNLLVLPLTIEKAEEPAGVLLPENYKRNESAYTAVRVLDVASDCSKPFLSLRKSTFTENRDIIVETSMLREVEYKNKKYYLILENYVMALLKSADDE